MRPKNQKVPKSIPPIPMDQQISKASKRLDQLKRQVSKSQDPFMGETLEEFEKSLEELNTTWEELAASRLIIEAERQRYQDLFNFAPDVYLVTTPEGIIREANLAAAFQLGLNQNAMIGKPLALFLDEADLRDLWKLLNRFRKGEKVQPIERDWVLKSPKGRSFPAAVLVAPEFGPGGGTQVLRWLIRDSSEKKKAEEKLKKYQDQLEKKVQSRTAELKTVNEQLNLLTNALPVLIAYVDSEQRYRFTNRAYEEWFGFSREKMEGKHLQELMGEFYRSIKTYVLQALSGQTTNFTILLKNKKEEARHIEAKYIPDMGDKGNVKGFFVLAQDVTERKRKEDELRKEREKVLSIFDGMDVAISVIDPNTFEILYANKASKTQFKKKLVGRKCYQAFQDLMQPCVFCTNNKIFGENLGKTYSWERQNLKNKHWYRCYDKAILWPDGRWVRYEIAIDITDSKRGEEERAHLQRRLESLWKISRLVEAEYALLCQTIVDEAVTLAESDYGFLGFLSEDQKEISISFWSGKALEEGGIANGPIFFPISQTGLWGEPVRQRKPIIINDCQADYPNKPGLPNGPVPITRILLVPIIRKGRIAVLVGITNKPTEYTQEDVQQLTIFLTNALLIMEKKKTEQALGKAEENYRSIFEDAVEGIFQS
ncbi:MAG: hypothetical protein C0407_08915, partial [Desulfobacca sp.]|nr:hypothetical protein [Desulfobacca sp.]